MSLIGYTDQQLMDELLERRLEEEREGEDREYCHDCAHFTPWKRRGEMPDDYNACSKKHQMRFHMPEPWEAPEDGGFYKRICSDRKGIEPIPPPAPEPPPAPPEPPIGREGWKPGPTIRGGKR